MIPIVAYGIMGTAYRQEVVVDEGVRENGSLKVLQDIRRHLSMQYGDDTPMTGWALQPAPAGMWLTRIERAFDANYSPAYIAIAFLIPQGRQPKSASMLKLITDTLSSHHSDYVRQSVIQGMVDWHFLEELSADLEAYLTLASNPLPPKPLSHKYGVAYSENDITTLLENLWDDCIAQCRMVFCGRGILTADKEFVCIEDPAPLDKPPTVNEIPITGTRNHQVTFVDKKVESPIPKPQRPKGSGTSQRNKIRRKRRTTYKVLVAVAILAVSLIGILVYNLAQKKPALVQEIYDCYNDMNKSGKRYCGDSLYNLASALTLQYSQLSDADRESFRTLFAEQYSPLAYSSFENSFNDQTERKRIDSEIYDEGLALLERVPKGNQLKPNHWKQKHEAWEREWYWFNHEKMSVLTKAHEDTLKARYQRTVQKIEELTGAEPVTKVTEVETNDNKDRSKAAEQDLYEKCTNPSKTSVNLCESYLKHYKKTAPADHVKNVELTLTRLKDKVAKEVEKGTNGITTEKTSIKSYDDLWNALAWDNFHPHGMNSFLEKYEFAGANSARMKQLAKDIIDAATKWNGGLHEFNKARMEAAKEPSSKDKLYRLRDNVCSIPPSVKK